MRIKLLKNYLSTIQNIIYLQPGNFNTEQPHISYSYLSLPFEFDFDDDTVTTKQDAIAISNNINANTNSLSSVFLWYNALLESSSVKNIISEELNP